MGQNTKDWLAEQRQRQAHELLCEGSSIKETASCMGVTSSPPTSPANTKTIGASVLPCSHPRLTLPGSKMSVNDSICPQMIGHSPFNTTFAMFQ
jgi:hypothetical protein